MNPGPVIPAKVSERAFRYAMGTGRVISKRHLPMWYAGYRTLRPLGGAMVALAKLKVDRAKMFFAVSRGVARGYMGWA